MSGTAALKKISGGVTAAKGFKAASTAAGIKYKDRKDMAMIYSEAPCRSAGTFTTNVVKAAPVKWDKNQVTGGAAAHAVVINAGIANACTGEEGMEYCSRTAATAAQVLGIPQEGVLVASTGVIGKQLPMDRIEAGIKAMAPLLEAGPESGTAASKAIMTTDTKNKEAAVQLELGGVLVTIGGMCKGSGMIHPNMCTMLSFVTTDAAISKELLQEALSQDIKDTYNMISVDGDTSTNDTCVVLANGLAGNPAITGPGEDYDIFFAALRHVCEYEAKMIASDGEGAGRLITCTVMGAETEEQAEQMAKAVVRSPLVKCAVFGTDANWGRVLCAIGYSGAQFDPKDVEVKFLSRAGELLVCAGGQGVAFDEALAKRVLSEDEVVIQVTLTSGSATCSCWGCDLTYDYVKINGDYRS